MLYSFGGICPSLEDRVYVSPTASVIGDVTLSSGSSCWFGTVIRGDEASIHIGKNSNIQDNSVVHCDRGIPVFVGEHVTVGHRVILHSCTIGDFAMIGMGAVVLSRAVIGEGAVIAAGAVVKEGEIVPPDTLYAGIPAVFKKQISALVRDANYANTMDYVHMAGDYLSQEAN